MTCGTKRWPGARMLCVMQELVSNWQVLSGSDAAGAASAHEGVSLGKTVDGKLGQRAIEVLRNVALPKRLKAELHDVDVLVARNLESLMMAARIAGSRPVVYECLDIHRLLLSDGLLARFVRAIERHLLSRSELVVVSSPAFEREYFAEKSGGPPAMVLENKVPSSIAAKRKATSPDPDGPFTIAWFGMLRCRKSFRVLSRLCAKYGGKLRVLIAGMPSTAEFDDFAGMVAKVPNMTFVGPYSPEELPDLYSQCHFAWTIDWFEEGLTATGCCPIASMRQQLSARFRSHFPMSRRAVGSDNGGPVSLSMTSVRSTNN